MIEHLILPQIADDFRAQADVFNELFLVFLVAGTLVGTIVVTYTLYHAYKYRDGSGNGDEEFDPPVLGELPTGQESGKSRKLFFSFGLSAILVISLVVYSYGLLLFVEEGPSQDVESDMEIDVVGLQFIWQFEYPNGLTTTNELRVPQGQVIWLEVTSDDVWHNFGVPELRIKSDAIPGQYSSTWFVANETGTYTAKCFELCGSGHSNMDAEIIVMPEDEFQQWYDEASSDIESGENATEDGDDTAESEDDGEDGGDGGHGAAGTAAARGVAV